MVEIGDYPLNKGIDKESLERERFYQAGLEPCQLLGICLGRIRQVGQLHDCAGDEDLVGSPVDRRGGGGCVGIQVEFACTSPNIDHLQEVQSVLGGCECDTQRVDA